MVTTPLASFTHDYDRATGTRRFLLSLDLVGLSALGLASLLVVRLLTTLSSPRGR